MTNVYNFWESQLIPNVVKFYKNPYLTAIRHSFYTLMPFWLTISALDILENLILNPNGLVMSSNGLNLGFWLTGGLSDEEYLNSGFVKTLSTYRHIVGLAYGIITVIITATLAGKLSDIFNSDKILTIFCALSAFILMSPPVDIEVSDYFSNQGFFSAFFTTFASSILFAYLSRQKRLQLKTPKSLPNELSKYIKKTLPILLTLLSFSIFSFIITTIRLNGSSFVEYLSTLTIFQNPLFALFYQFIVWLLWWLGIPGYGVTSEIIDIAYNPAQISNQIGDTSAIFTTGFFAAGVIHLMGLMIAILVFSQHERWRSVSKFSLPVMMFNVQEIFIFGLPVILNPIFLVPYILAPLADTLVGYVAISWGIVPVFQVDIPWTMPLFLSAAAGTHSFMGGILQIVWLIMDIFIYAPFVITANAVELKD